MVSFRSFQVFGKECNGDFLNSSILGFGRVYSWLLRRVISGLNKLLSKISICFVKLSVLQKAKQNEMTCNGARNWHTKQSDNSESRTICKNPFQVSSKTNDLRLHYL